MSRYDSKQGVQGIATLTDNPLATCSVVGGKKQMQSKPTSAKKSKK